MEDQPLEELGEDHEAEAEAGEGLPAEEAAEEAGPEPVAEDGSVHTPDAEAREAEVTQLPGSERDADEPAEAAEPAEEDAVEAGPAEELPLAREEGDEPDDADKFSEAAELHLVPETSQEAEPGPSPDAAAVRLTSSEDQVEPPADEQLDEHQAELQDLDEEALPEEEEPKEDEEPEDEGPSTMEKLLAEEAELRELNERAQQQNAALQGAIQKRVMQRKAQDSSFDTSAAERQAEGKITEHKYQNVLRNVHAIRLKLRLQQVKAARMSEELKKQLEMKREKAIECRDSFQNFKREVARHAEYARTSKKIPEKIILEVEEFELDKDAEVEEVRGSNISLKNRLAKLEQALRKKDELAENLHVIDFEQLKIENQTLNEKIEERNEELHKLRKKTVVTVQIITHMREKVQFVQREHEVLESELKALDKTLADQRELMTKTKHERDEHRTEYAKLKKQTGIMNSEHLTKDYEARAEHIKTLKEEIEQLQQRHKQMARFVKANGGSI